jgi:hypothetical protein
MPPGRRRRTAAVTLAVLGVIAPCAAAAGVDDVSDHF